MLSDDVRRSTNLKVILLVHAGHQIGVVEGYAIVGIRAEEERFRRSGSGDVSVPHPPRAKEYEIAGNASRLCST